MDIQNVTQVLVDVVIFLAVTVIAPLISQYVRKKTAGTMIEEAVDIVLDAVDQTNQTFADELRSSGKFDEASQKEALKRSVETALSTMNKRMIKFLEAEFNDVEAWIVTKIEAACKANKDARSTQNDCR